MIVKSPRIANLLYLIAGLVWGVFFGIFVGKELGAFEMILGAL